MGGKDADGREIEGFGVLAQLQGAKGVLATLWPVSDKSTGMLMQHMYELRVKEHLTKAAALQKAQTMFITGSSNVSDDGDNARGRVIMTGKAKGKRAARYKIDPERPYAHPFYRAPFILMGNWL